MSLHTEVVAGIAPQWAGLCASGPFLASTGWLTAMTGRLGERTVTILVHEHGQARLAALATVVATPRSYEFFDLHHILISAAPSLPLIEASRDRRAELAATAPDPSRWTPSLVVMLPGYECVPVGPGRDDPRLLNALVDGARRWADDQGLRAVAFLYTRPEATALAGALRGHDFTAVPLSLTWELAVTRDGLDAYIRDLPRKRRQEATREMLRLREAGVAVRHLDPDQAVSDETLGDLARLRCQLVRKYRGDVDEEGERRRLDSLVTDVCGGKAHVIAAEADGRMIGFALFAAYDDVWHCLAVGYDYTDARSRLAYFGTAFYGAVAAAAEVGARSLGYGQGAAQAKRARGCTGTPLTGWVRSSDPDLDAALRASARITELQSIG